MSDTRPPLDYLLTCSHDGLESLELSRLNRASNLRKQLRETLERWVESEVEARFARWLLESGLGQYSGLKNVPGAPPADVMPRARPLAQSRMAFLPEHCAASGDAEMESGQAVAAPRPARDEAVSLKRLPLPRRRRGPAKAARPQGQLVLGGEGGAWTGGNTAVVETGTGAPKQSSRRKPNGLGELEQTARHSSGALRPSSVITADPPECVDRSPSSANGESRGAVSTGEVVLVRADSPALYRRWFCAVPMARPDCGCASCLWMASS